MPLTKRHAAFTCTSSSRSRPSIPTSYYCFSKTSGKRSTRHRKIQGSTVKESVSKHAHTLISPPIGIIGLSRNKPNSRTPSRRTVAGQYTADHRLLISARQAWHRQAGVRHRSGRTSRRTQTSPARERGVTPGVRRSARHGNPPLTRWAVELNRPSLSVRLHSDGSTFSTSSVAVPLPVAHPPVCLQPLATLDHVKLQGLCRNSCRRA